MSKPNWTAGPTGSNSSDAFLEIVADVERVLGNIRLGSDLNAEARLIVARLAHVHHLVPSERPQEQP